MKPPVIPGTRSIAEIHGQVEAQIYSHWVNQLLNWGRWARVRLDLTSGRCGSIEGHYLPPREDEQKLLKLANPRMDVEEAERVERAVCLVPRDDHRFLIVKRYAEGWRHAKFVRVLKITGAGGFRALEEQVEAKLYLATKSVADAYAWDEASGRVGNLPGLVLARHGQRMLRMRARIKSGAQAYE